MPIPHSKPLEMELFYSSRVIYVTGNPRKQIFTDLDLLQVKLSDKKYVQELKINFSN